MLEHVGVERRADPVGEDEPADRRALERAVAPARPTTASTTASAIAVRDAELARGDRPEALLRVLAVLLDVVGVVDQVAGRGDRAEGDEGDRRGEDRVDLVELAREQQPREDEQVLDPLLRAHRRRSPRAAGRGGASGSRGRRRRLLAHVGGLLESRALHEAGQVRGAGRAQSRGGIDQHAGVEDAPRVELRLGGAQRRRERVRALAVVPGAVVAADRVVVGDRAAGVDHRVRDGGLDLVPLLDLGAAPRRGEHRVVGRGPVRIDVREAAADPRRARPLGRRARTPRRPPRGPPPSPRRGSPGSGPR